MEIYHQHNRGLPLADRIGYIARLRMYRLFLECMRPDPASRRRMRARQRNSRGTD